MGWFKKAVKRLHKNSTKFITKWTGVDTAKDLLDGVTGKTAAKAQEAAQAEAIEQARKQRIASAQGAQFAQDNVTQAGAGNVVLGTQQTDETLEDQLKRLKGGAR